MIPLLLHVLYIRDSIRMLYHQSIVQDKLCRAIFLVIREIRINKSWKHCIREILPISEQASTEDDKVNGTPNNIIG